MTKNVNKFSFPHTLVVIIICVTSIWEHCLVTSRNNKLRGIQFGATYMEVDQLANLHFRFTSVPRYTPMTGVEVKRNSDGDTPSSTEDTI